MATVSDFIVVHGGEFWLPNILTSGGKTHVTGIKDLSFELPAGVKSTGILSWIVSTSKGDDDEIDLAYKLQGYSWNHHSHVYFGIQLPIGGLVAGKNTIRFEVTKGGKVTAPDPDENIAGGEGKLRIGQVCLHYQRNQ
jgi:hypothetical protein